FLATSTPFWFPAKGGREHVRQIGEGLWKTFRVGSLPTWLGRGDCSVMPRFPAQRKAWFAVARVSGSTGLRTPAEPGVKPHPFLGNGVNGSRLTVCPMLISSSSTPLLQDVGRISRSTNLQPHHMVNVIHETKE